jgi:hypothetical protein
MHGSGATQQLRVQHTRIEKAWNREMVLDLRSRVCAAQNCLDRNAMAFIDRGVDLSVLADSS